MQFSFIYKQIYKLIVLFIYKFNDEICEFKFREIQQILITKFE